MGIPKIILSIATTVAIVSAIIAIVRLSQDKKKSSNAKKRR